MVGSLLKHDLAGALQHHSPKYRIPIHLLVGSQLGSTLFDGRGGVPKPIHLHMAGCLLWALWRLYLLALPQDPAHPLLLQEHPLHPPQAQDHCWPSRRLLPSSRMVPLRLDFCIFRVPHNDAPLRSYTFFLDSSAAPDCLHPLRIRLPLVSFRTPTLRASGRLPRLPPQPRDGRELHWKFVSVGLGLRGQR